jgi:5'-methylthioadenosine phosphorylase
MTAMPEAKLAREAQMCYGLVALVSDYDCWREHHGAEGPELIKEIIGNLNAATANALKLIEAALGSGFELADGGCGCRKSLELAVWSDGDVIDDAERERLGILFE